MLCNIFSLMPAILHMAPNGVALTYDRVTYLIHCFQPLGSWPGSLAGLYSSIWWDNWNDQGLRLAILSA